jgi:hypothetical protein
VLRVTMLLFYLHTHVPQIPFGGRFLTFSPAAVLVPGRRQHTDPAKVRVPRAGAPARAARGSPAPAARASRDERAADTVAARCHLQGYVTRQPKLRNAHRAGMIGV